MGRFIPIMFTMGIWGYLTALRYLERTDRGARFLRPDGKPLLRPLRVRSPAVLEAARIRRAGRRQPLWPRVLGWSFIGMALLAAVRAEYPIARPISAVSSATPTGTLVAIRPDFPTGSLTSVPAGFRWKTLVEPPFTVVLYDAAYEEIGRLEGIEGRNCPLPSEWLAAVQGGGTYHWRVLGTSSGQAVRSPLAEFDFP